MANNYNSKNKGMMSSFKASNIQTYKNGGQININPKNEGKFTISANAAGMGVQEFATHVLANKDTYSPLQVQRANFAHNAAGWSHAGGGFMNKGFQALPKEVQDKIRSRSFAEGGQLTEFNEGGTHEESPLGGIPQGSAPDGKLNLVEQGETKLNAADYVFSDRIKVDKETATLYGLPKGDVGKTFADVSKKLNRPNSRRDNDTIEQVAIQRDLENLMQAQEKQKEITKQNDIAEFASKYPDLAQNLPMEGEAPQGPPQGVPAGPDAGMQQMDPQQQQMMQQQMMQQQQMQGQEQMAPPAGMPQEQMDPAMMAQMGQMPMSYGGSLFNCGGKMYSDGGHMYGVGGNVLRGIGAGAYGVGEGLLDTLTFGLTDNLTDKGYNKLANMGGRSQSEVEKDNMIRGFGNAGGAVLGAGLTGGAATSAAVSEGAEGLASGASNIKGTGEKFDKIAGGIGQGVSMAAGFMGPEGAVEAKGIMKGNEAVNQLMKAKQNPFINQATTMANNAFAQGGHMQNSMYFPLEHVTQEGGQLNMPTNSHPYLNVLAGGGPLDAEPLNFETTIPFNNNGIVINYTLDRALTDPLVLSMYGATPEIPESVEQAKLAIKEHFASAEEQKKATPYKGIPSFIPEVMKGAGKLVAPAGNNLVTTEKKPGESEADYQSRLAKMNTKMDNRALVGEMKQTPLQAGMMALPAAYNLGRGLFEKPNTLNYNDYKQSSTLEPYTMNIDPQLAEVRKSYAGADRALKNAAPSAGAYISNMANLASERQRNINDLLTKKEMFDKEGKFKTDLNKQELASKNLELKVQIQKYNDAALAAKHNMLATGFGQLADIANNAQSAGIQEQYIKAVSPDMAKDFKYSSIFDQLNSANKKRKAAKGN